MKSIEEGKAEFQLDPTNIQFYQLVKLALKFIQHTSHRLFQETTNFPQSSVTVKILRFGGAPD